MLIKEHPQRRNIRDRPTGAAPQNTPRPSRAGPKPPLRLSAGHSNCTAAPEEHQVAVARYPLDRRAIGIPGAEAVVVAIAFRFVTFCLLPLRGGPAFQLCHHWRR